MSILLKFWSLTFDYFSILGKEVQAIGPAPKEDTGYPQVLDATRKEP